MLFVCQDRAEALAKLGHEVYVLTTGGQPHIRLNGVTVFHLPCAPQVYSSEFAALCVEQCKQLEPDVLHFDSADLQRPWWTERPGNPRVVAVTMHGFSFGGWLTKWNLYRCGLDPREPTFPAAAIRREAEILRKTFDRVLAISLHEQTMLEDQYGIPQARLVRNPIADYFFDLPTVLPPDNKRFLCAAISGHGQRGFKLAEQAAKAAGVQLQVVSDCVRSKMPCIIDECQGLLLPTFYAQGYDLTVAEALARRRPVVVSATGSYLREWGTSGWPYHDGFESPVITFPAGDAEALAAILRKPMPVVEEEFTDDSHRPKFHAKRWLEALELA